MINPHFAASSTSHPVGFHDFGLRTRAARATAPPAAITEPFRAWFRESYGGFHRGLPLNHPFIAGFSIVNIVIIINYKPSIFWVSPIHGKYWKIHWNIGCDKKGFSIDHLAIVLWETSWVPPEKLMPGIYPLVI